MRTKIDQRIDIINAQKPYQFEYDPTPEEINTYVNNYEHEKIVCHYVKMGDIDGLQKYWSSDRVFNIHLGYSQGFLRNEKNYANYVITVVSRAAIDGGLDVALSFSLAHQYQAQVETMEDAKQILLFIGQIITKFCTHVNYHKISQYTSPLIDKAIRYIQRNINTKLSTSMIAEALHISDSYLCTIFKIEVGKTVMTYITERKIDEAKMILRTPDASIADVSNYLNFSSQSYFQNIFKRYTGITPNEYRKQFSHLKTT